MSAKEIYSHHLYSHNMYMDDLTTALNKYNTGCVTGNKTISHLMYAVDLVIMSPSRPGWSAPHAGLWPLRVKS